jgi:hypothetical protein
MNTPTPSMDGGLVERAARATAQSLIAEHGEQLATDVDVALHNRERGKSAPDQYFDPISLGALIVSAATLAWTIYNDQRKHDPKSDPEVLARRVRLELRASEHVSKKTRDRIIEVVVEGIAGNSHDRNA